MQPLRSSRFWADGEIQHLLCDTHVVQPPQGLSVLISSEAGYLWQLLRDGINAIDSKAEQQGRHVITSDMVKYMAL